MRISETFAALPAIQARAKIPPHKRKTQWVKTLAGGIVFVGGFLLPHFLGFPWQVGAVVSAFGAFTISAQLVLGFLKAAVQFLPALLGALGKKTP